MYSSLSLFRFLQVRYASDWQVYTHCELCFVAESRCSRHLLGSAWQSGRQTVETLLFNEERADVA
jgi:hypothetical protein